MKFSFAVFLDAWQVSLLILLRASQ